MKLQIKCTSCGRELGLYIGESFYLLGAEGSLAVRCETCYIENQIMGMKKHD